MYILNCVALLLVSIPPLRPINLVVCITSLVGSFLLQISCYRLNVCTHPIPQTEQVETQTPMRCC